MHRPFDGVRHRELPARPGRCSGCHTDIGRSCTDAQRDTGVLADLGHRCLDVGDADADVEELGVIEHGRTISVASDPARGRPIWCDRWTNNCRSCTSTTPFPTPTATSSRVGRSRSVPTTPNSPRADAVLAGAKRAWNAGAFALGPTMKVISANRHRVRQRRCRRRDGRRSDRVQRTRCPVGVDRRAHVDVDARRREEPARPDRPGARGLARRNHRDCAWSSTAQCSGWWVTAASPAVSVPRHGQWG